MAESAKSELFDDYEVESATGKIMQINKSGLDLAECIAWSVESSGMKQAEKFQLLRNWTMSENAKKTIVGTLIGTEMKTETGKDSKYAKMLEALKSGVTIDEYLDMCLDGTEIEDCLVLIEEGMDSDTAYELLDYVSDLELKKEDLSKIETWKLRVNFSTKPHVQLAALAGVMSKDEFAKVNILFDFGVEPEAFVKYHEICNQFDANRNGSFTYAEVEAAVKSINGLTRQQKAALWQMVSGSKNGNRNPFDRAIGKQVVDAKLANG